MCSSHRGTIAIWFQQSKIRKSMSTNGFSSRSRPYFDVGRPFPGSQPTQNHSQRKRFEVDENVFLNFSKSKKGGPTCGEGALACWNCKKFLKMKHMRAELRNFLGNVVSCERFWELLFGNFCFRPEHSCLKLIVVHLLVD